MQYETNQMGRRSDPGTTADVLARELGWFSLALGAVEVAAPHRLDRTLGMEGYESLVFAYGVREIVKGVGILASEDPTPWIWGRVAGDALDIATVAAGISGDNPRKVNAAVALVSLLGVAAVDLYCARMLGEEGPRPLAPALDYRDRGGFPRSPEAMHGAAREDDFEIPEDMRGPPALRPYNDGHDATSTAAVRH